jgi:hypothetical protein
MPTVRVASREKVEARRCWPRRLKKPGLEFGVWSGVWGISMGESNLIRAAKAGLASVLRANNSIDARSREPTASGTNGLDEDAFEKVN